ncbi:MAG: hypothetical protein AB8B50_09440 [Pirellulaceae bacterium]
MKFTSAFIAGQLFLWLGFLGGSFATVLRKEIPDAPWQTIPWMMYGCSLLVGGIGVVMLRSEKASQAEADGDSDAGFAVVKEQLKKAAKAVATLQQNLDEMTCEEVLDYIDENCVPPCTEFADSRMVISQRYGNAKYAEVMTEFASGERYVNRTWSAAADGYVDEVEVSASHAHTFFQAAVSAIENTTEQTS